MKVIHFIPINRIKKILRFEIGARQSQGYKNRTSELVSTLDRWNKPYSFDLLMPFVNWPFEYEKSGDVCGRPAHLFSFSAPNEQSFFGTNIKSGWQ